MKTFEQIYAEYKDKVFKFISLKLKNREQAEDLTQETFIKVYRFLSLYNDEWELSTWIYKIATNVVIDYYREKKLETADIAMFISEEGDIMSNVLSKHCTKKTPEIVLIDKEILANVQDKISTLPSNIKKTAEMFFNLELNYKEIADALDMPLGTVKNNIFRAREILQTNLKHEHEMIC